MRVAAAAEQSTALGEDEELWASLGRCRLRLPPPHRRRPLALANANFDMSLIRIEAPSEYKTPRVGPGEEYTQRRRRWASSRHRTAFGIAVPEHPTRNPGLLGLLWQNLIRAYGTRASEIAGSPEVNPKGSDAHGPFKDYVGVDGTSIWAAATSGSAAIAAHLLACFIATCWAADEATAIWMELVAERKRRIQTKAATAEYFDLSDTLSTKLELDKAQLANWDASARSCQYHRARTAGPFHEPWHLYPDLIVLGSRTEDIHQNDELVEPGGCITVGLRSHSLSHNEAFGVHWSLSLAHLRYHGTPKPTSRTITNAPSGNERFSREEFTLILIGVIISRWRDEMDVSVDQAMSFMKLVVSKFVELFQTEHPERLGSWVEALKIAFGEYEAVDSRVGSLARKFINLGLRNQTMFKPSATSSRSWQQFHPHHQDINTALFGLGALHSTHSFSQRKQPSRKLLLMLEKEADEEPRKLYIFTSSELKGLGKDPLSPHFIREGSRSSYHIVNVQDHSFDVRGGRLYSWIDPPKPILRYMKKHFHKATTLFIDAGRARYDFLVYTATSHFVVLEYCEEKGKHSIDSFPAQAYHEIEYYLRHTKLNKDGVLHLAAREPFFAVLRLISRMLVLTFTVCPASIWSDLVAVSTDDSLYINPVCLGNLYLHPNGSLEIRRVRGNVGRPGLSLLGWFTGAQNAEWRQPSMDMWHVVNHNPFQGRLEDVFTGTSLHLKFTGWNRDLDFGRDKCVPDGSYLEAIMSAYDTGTWLGDLTYPHTGSPTLHIISAVESCTGATPVIGTMPPEDLVLVEHWEELLSPHPSQPAVVMCHGNWQTRVTAISLSLNKGYRKLNFNGHVCWHCAFSLLGKLKRDEAKKVLKHSTKHKSRPDSDDSVSDYESESPDSDYEASSSDSEEDRDSKEAEIVSKATGESQSAEKEKHTGQDGGDDATLVDQGEASDSLAEALGKAEVDGPTDDTDSEASTADISPTFGEDDKLEEILRTLPYKPMVFIL
ncbi:hypothetical protein PG994_005207 [Apiospora phragmitis]|uniref:Uncharacterized protein n=1 Tax=Apiospora phragmitis TaxID=2905665 RepID=A0ABR1VSS7_9PEZI